MPVAPVALLGGGLAIFLGFRNNSAYDRWWEARKIWGGIVNTSRTFGIQVQTYVNENTIKPEFQFYYKKKTADKKASQRLKNIFFTPIQNFKLVNANVKYVAAGDSCLLLEGKKQKQEITEAPWD